MEMWQCEITKHLPTQCTLFFVFILFLFCMSHVSVLICRYVLHQLGTWFLCSSEERWDLELNTTGSTHSIKCTTDNKCNYRQAAANLIMSSKVCYFSLAKKNYPTAVINPGCSYRDYFYYWYMLLWGGGFEQTFLCTYGMDVSQW